MKTGDILYEMDFSEATFDRENHVVNNVVLLGPVSKHGYRYLESAMQKAVPLYEGTQAYINHPDLEEQKLGRRDVRNLAGQFSGVQVREGKVHGNFKGLPNESGKLFVDVAETLPNVAGLSQNAQGKFSINSSGEKIVEEITKVFSVDLVATPATTNGMFESEVEKQRSSDMEWLDIKLEDLKIKRKDIVEALVQEGKESRDAEFATIVTENKDLKTKVDEHEVKEAAVEKTEKINKKLSDSKLPKAAITDVFKEALLTAEDDKAVDGLIKDRLAVVSSGGVKNMGSGKGRKTTESTNDGTEASIDEAHAALRS